MLFRREHSGARPNWALFLAAGVCMGVATGIYETIFNNFLSDVHRVTPALRGILEFPREMPGVLVVLVTASLCFIAETRLAALAISLWCLGMFGLGLLSPGMPPLIFWMIVGSTGMHLFMPLNQSIGVAVAEDKDVGRKLGVLGGANTAAAIAGAGLVLLGTGALKIGYTMLFAIAGAVLVLALAGMLLMRMPRCADAGEKRFNLVYKRRYGLYYVLSILYGARKQLFITFGPWVLIKVFHQPAAAIAMLWVIASVLGIFFKPLLGRLVDLWGERRILMGEAGVLILVCAGYAAGWRCRTGGVDLGLGLVYACYVLDQLLIAAGIARTTYLCKIAENRGDVASTAAMGISMDHVVSVVVAALGGLLWKTRGYQAVFLAAMGLALLNMAAAARVKTPGPAAAYGTGTAAGD